MIRIPVATIMNTITAIVVMSIVQTMVAMEIRDRTNLMDLFLTFAKSQFVMSVE